MIRLDRDTIYLDSPTEWLEEFERWLVEADLAAPLQREADAALSLVSTELARRRAPRIEAA